jgi:hypothetical protein
MAIICYLISAQFIFNKAAKNTVSIALQTISTTKLLYDLSRGQVIIKIAFFETQSSVEHILFSRPDQK